MNFWIDKSAIGLSGLCLIHCLLGTLILAALSAGGSQFFSHSIHQIGLAFAIPLALLGLSRGVLNHGRWTVVVVGALGIAFMAGALWTGHGSSELVFTLIGVTLVAMAHVLNIRWMQA